MDQILLILELCFCCICDCFTLPLSFDKGIFLLHLFVDPPGPPTLCLYCVRQLTQRSDYVLENDTYHIVVERRCLYNSACSIKNDFKYFSEQYCCTVFWTSQGPILPMICASQVKFIGNFNLFSSKLWSIERYKILHMTPHAASEYAKMGAIRQPGVELRQYERSFQLDLWVKNGDRNVFQDPCID